LLTLRGCRPECTTEEAEKAPHYAFAGEVGRNFFPLATLLDSAEFALKPVQIVLAGALDDTVFTELRRAIYRVSLPNRIVVAALPGCDLPPDNLAHAIRGSRWRAVRSRGTG
jgi:hypothetical protein